MTLGLRASPSPALPSSPTAIPASMPERKMTRYRTTRGVHGQTKSQASRRLFIAVRFLQRWPRVTRLLLLACACVPLVVAAVVVPGCAALVSWGQYGPDAGAG